MKKSKIKFLQILIGILCSVFLISAARAQSTSQTYPTAVTTGEISGKIPARDIGDSRLTNYFYTFNGRQGDVFINVQTANFNGDIDVFTADNLKPLTKITIYADDPTGETGRVVYLRQPAKLILRVEGRPPNDEAATFRIKFAGSFEPAPFSAENSAPELPEVKTETASDVRVNSVGTIIEVKPKPTPTPKETVAKNEPKPPRKTKNNAVGDKKTTVENSVVENVTKPPIGDENAAVAEEVKKETPTEKIEPKIENKPAPMVSVTDEKVEPEATKVETPPASSKNATENVTEKTPSPAAKRRAARNARAVRAAKPVAEPKIRAPNPLENVHLIILLKDGARVERPMSEVIKVGVDKGVLTVIANDGSIKRFQILDVAKMTIE